MERFSIVFVCTGNRFRSPLAAAFVDRLTLGMPVTTASRGVLRLKDAPPLREALELSPWFGIDLSGHRAQQLEPSMPTADLVLGFEQVHLRYAVVDAGVDRSRAFTLPELVTLLDGVARPATVDVVSAARELVAHAAVRRDELAGRAIAPDVPDPFGRSWKAQCRIASDIRELVIRLVASLFGISATTGLPPLPADLTHASRTRSFWRRSASRR